MTVPSETNRSGPYNGNGVTTVFSYGFRILDETHLEVIKTYIEGGEEVLDPSTDYTVSGVGDPAGGSITLGLAPITGEKITILRNVPFTQETDLENQGAYYAETIEDALDLATMRDQQVSERLSRTLALPASVTGVSTVLPAPEADKLLAWNSSEDALRNIDRAELVSSVVYGTARAETFTGDDVTTEFTLLESPGALFNMDVSIGGVTQVPGDDYTWDGGATVTFTSPPANGLTILIRYMQALAQGTGDAASTIFIQGGVGAIERTMQDKGREIVSVFDFSSHFAADTSGNMALFVPQDIVSTRANGADVFANHWGPGQVVTANGNKRGKWFSNVPGAPSSFGDHDSIETAFNGDLSHSIFQVEHRITGASTLGTPATGYSYTPEAFPFYGVIYNASGHNQETNGNGGRTGAAFFRVNIKQYGQGDLVAYNGSAFVTGSKPGATHFLANPAAVLFNGDISAGQAGVYLNPREIIMHDNGYDVAGIGDVVNMNRTNGTGALNCWWTGYRAQSIGTQPVDSILSAVGLFKNGIDLSVTGLDFGANKAAISIKRGDRIYLKNTASDDRFTDTYNPDFIEYAAGIDAIHVVVNNASILQVYGSQVVANGVPLVAQNLRANGATTAVAAGQLGFGTTTAATAATGASGALPAQVAGYLVANLAGTSIKLPYYNF